MSEDSRVQKAARHTLDFQSSIGNGNGYIGVTIDADTPKEFDEALELLHNLAIRLDREHQIRKVPDLGPVPIAPEVPLSPDKIAFTRRAESDRTAKPRDWPWIAEGWRNWNR